MSRHGVSRVNLLSKSSEEFCINSYTVSKAIISTRKKNPEGNMSLDAMKFSILGTSECFYVTGTLLSSLSIGSAAHILFLFFYL